MLFCDRVALCRGLSADGMVVKEIEQRVALLLLDSKGSRARCERTLSAIIEIVVPICIR